MIIMVHSWNTKTTWIIGLFLYNLSYIIKILQSYTLEIISMYGGSVSSIKLETTSK